MEGDYSISLENKALVLPTKSPFSTCSDRISGPSSSSLYIIKSVTVTPGENGPAGAGDTGKLCTLDFSILPREVKLCNNSF